MSVAEADAAASLNRAQYTALSAWLQGVPADQVVMRWLVPGSTKKWPTSRAAMAIVEALLGDARHMACQHGRSSLVCALAPARWTSKTRRSAVQALRRLEALGTPVPKPWQELDLWLSSRTVACLADAGVQTFDDLIALGNRYGRNWFHRVPGLGAIGAGRVGAFLYRHAEVFPGMDARAMYALYAPPATALQRPVNAIAPDAGDPFAARWQAVMHLVPSNAPSTHARAWQLGQAEPTLCEPHDDEAIQRWLAQWSPDSATRRAYAKEVVRFVAWLRIEQGKALSATLPSDCVAYAVFLSRLSPDSKWCGPPVPRVIWIGETCTTNPVWRPFAGPLSSRSQAHSCLVLRLLFKWLVRQHYLVTNPWVDIYQVKPEARPKRSVLEIPNQFWEILYRWLDYEARGSARARLWRAAMLLLAETGLSCEDATVAQLAKVSVSPPTWELVAQRQDGKTRAAPASPRLLAALVAHWNDRDDRPCYALGYPRGTHFPGKSKLEATAGPAHYRAPGLRQLVRQALRAFTSALAPDQRALGQWVTQVRLGNLSHGVVARSLPERLRGQDRPLQITVRHRHRQ